MPRIEEKDMLEECFALQSEFMGMLKDFDRLPDWPIDLKSKAGQRMIKEVIHNLNEELFEASFTMKNRVHRLSDDRTFDAAHYREELGDAFAFFMELCILSGITPVELFEEYRRKNRIVKARLESGY